MDGQMNEQMNEQVEESGKKGKGALIAVLAVIILLAGGLTLWFFVFKDKNTPESVAQEILNASEKKDWKTIIDKTPDEALEVLLDVDAEVLQKKGISTVKELRDWAVSHTADVPDPMNGKGVKGSKVDEVVRMTTKEYIDTFLAGEGDNAYYSFLKKQSEIAVVKVSYVMVDADKELERKDSVVEYERNGTWFPLSGLIVVDGMLRTIE